MPHSSTLNAVLRQYPLPPADFLEPLDNAGGFSGAALWRVTIGPAKFCLRCWPEGTARSRLQAINDVLSHVRSLDVPFVSHAYRLKDWSVGDSQRPNIVAFANFLWTLHPWMPGQPVLEQPAGETTIRAALASLARFHLAAATYSGDGEFARADVGPPPGLATRAELCQQYLSGTASRIEAATIPARMELIRPLRQPLLAHFRNLAPDISSRVRGCLELNVPRQVCIRDVRAAHVLFKDDEVTGLIDFDALRVDCIASDIARLLGDYAGDEAELWAVGIAAYEKIRPLTADERRLIGPYDQTAVLLTGMQWLDWILLQGKEFQPAAVLARLTATLSRLEHLSRQLRT